MQAPRSAPLLLLALASTIAGVGCGAETTGASAPSAERAAAAVARTAENPEPGYHLQVELPPETTRGREAIAHVRVQPKAPWHMNLDYPAKLRLEAPTDVDLVASLLHKGDAARFDDEGLEFSVLFTPRERGARTITAQLDFAVCGADACGPVSESVELAFEVRCNVDDTGLC